MEVLIATEFVVGACLLATVAVVAFVVGRRHVLQQGGDLLLCSLRPQRGARWRSGLLRYDSRSIGWFPLLGWSLRPQCCWQREGIEMSGFVDIPTGETVEGASVIAALQSGPGDQAPDRAELAMGREAYTALRAWIEAGSPGGRPVDC